MMAPQPLYEIRADHGEGPVWDPVEKQLYWVDIMEGRYYKADFKSGTVSHFDVGQPLGVLCLRKKWGLVVALRDGFGLWNEEGHHLQLVNGTPERDNPEVRFNDGAVDPAGRFFAGTMEWEGAKPIGKLYRMDPNMTFHLMEENLYITNGMGWDPAHRYFFLIDTPRRVMYRYDYDITTGDIKNRSDYIHFNEGELPDGMTIDSRGGFWVAIFGSAKIVHFNAEGERQEEILLPVPHPTSCCFGGPDMKTLFITTSQQKLSEQEKAAYPLAGRLFHLKTKVRGQVEPRFRG